MDVEKVFKDGKICGTQATFHGLREYFREYVVKRYSFEEIIGILDDLEKAFLKKGEK